MRTDLLTITYTLENIDAAAKQFWERLRQYHLFAFSGEMGAGKTTFIHHLCDYLRVTDAVSSPTFALINEYYYPGTHGGDNIIYHIDWYRLKSTDEAIQAGMEDCILQAHREMAVCFIEWPEKAKDLLTAPYVWISIEAASVSKRIMSAALIS